jgi:hypothetical protein
MREFPIVHGIHEFLTFLHTVCIILAGLVGAIGKFSDYQGFGMRRLTLLCSYYHHCRALLQYEFIAFLIYISFLTIRCHSRRCLRDRVWLQLLRSLLPC